MFILQALILSVTRFWNSSPLSLVGSCLQKHPSAEMTACRKQGWRINFILRFYYLCFSMGELFWILNRLKSKNPLCKRMIESISPSTTPWVSTKQDLNWVVMEILIISERCALPRKIRIQKSLSAISRVWEASERGLQKEKALCFLPRISLQVGVPPQKPFSAAGWAPGQVWHHTCDHRATASAPRLRTGFDPLWNTSKNSSITYLGYKRPAWGLDGISPTLLCKKNSKKLLPKIHTHTKKSTAFVPLGQ